MNQCILMAEVVQPPQTRYTPDQTAIAEALVQYPGLRPEDPAGTLKVVGWGNLAQEVQDRCQPGQRFVFEGRLRMNTIERPEGFKEKLVELNISKIHDLNGELLAMDAAAAGPASNSPASNPASNPATRSASAPPARAAAPRSQPAAASPQPDYDDIPF
ncbi:MAG: single-stranded DNA-binding protein, partial [Synechococcales cyanobacterium RM1_1_8]|nr:single-stranded DNA-binding protein [Synechococcales cyanobacterium RM1_1_8]